MRLNLRLSVIQSLKSDINAYLGCKSINSATWALRKILNLAWETLRICEIGAWNVQKAYLGLSQLTGCKCCCVGVHSLHKTCKVDLNSYLGLRRQESVADRDAVLEVKNLNSRPLVVNSLIKLSSVGEGYFASA